MHTRTLALAVVILAAMLDLVDGTVVNVVLPVIIRDLGAGGAAAGWIASAYPVALGALLVLGAGWATGSATGACCWPGRWSARCSPGRTCSGSAGARCSW